MAELRAKKAGIGAEIEKKMEQRYEQEEQAGTMESIQLWVNSVLQGDHEPIPSCSQRELHKCLRDGVMLCKLINKLLESEGKSKVQMQKKVASMFVAYTNIENFNNGCLQYGLPKEFTVQSTDVWEGRKGPFLNVINCLHSLATLANSKGYPVMYTGEVNKTLSFE